MCFFVSLSPTVCVCVQGDLISETDLPCDEVKLGVTLHTSGTLETTGNRKLHNESLIQFRPERTIEEE